MVMPLGFEQVQRRAALRLRNLPPPQEGAQRQEAQHGRRRRRRLRARSAEQRRRRSISFSKRPTRPATSPASRCGSPWTSPPPSSTTPRPSKYTIDGKRARLGRHGRPARRLGREVSDLLDRRRLQRRRLGRLEAAHRAARQRRCSSWATTCSSPTPSGCSAASTKASPTASSSR